MTVEGLELPKELQRLISIGWWPSSQEEAKAQNLKPLIPRPRVQETFPQEQSIYFYPPPFGLFAEEVSGNSTFWDTLADAVSEIEPDKALDIGDFGAGSDSPILLDYRSSATSPSVLYLKYEKGVFEAHWQQCANSFKEFMEMLGVEI